ncbi:hypothetical protein ONZ45_g12742 [Pleurotus djamor]|nr:hypothetical protein ONZ45_g12742 [Pleurotus djamor]
MHCYRILQGFPVHVNDDGGPVGYLGDLRKWHHILKALLYVTQEVLGNAAATYRCFIIWNRKWRVVAVPVILLMGSTATGYACCGRFAQFQTDPVISIFDARLYSWVLSFYVLVVAQNIITTSLMAYRLWNTSRKTAQFKATENRLLPILRIIVESAALQLLVEILLLALYAQRLNAQHILLELVAAVVCPFTLPPSHTMPSAPTVKTPTNTIPLPLSNPTPTNHPKSCLVSLVFALSCAQQAGRLPKSGSIQGLELCEACSRLRDSPVESSASCPSTASGGNPMVEEPTPSSPPLMPHPHSGLFPVEMELALVYANCDAFRQLLRSRAAQFALVESAVIRVACALLSGSGGPHDAFELALVLLDALKTFKHALAEEVYRPI